MDLFGPLRVRSANGRKYILVITDAFTKYTEFAALEDKRVDKVGFFSPPSEDEDSPVLHYSAEPDFGAYIESASDLGEEKQEEEKEAAGS